MERRDVLLLGLTILFYITLMFQFLGATYVSLVADMLPTMIRIVTLFGLSLGLFWFMIGCITLTIIVYTSDYWKKWRISNKRKVLILPQASEKVNPIESAAELDILDDPSILFHVDDDVTQHQYTSIQNIDLSRSCTCLIKKKYESCRK